MMQGLHVDTLRCIRESRIVFESLSFNVNPGETLLITGQNGSGKSSLLRLLANIALPVSGNITFHPDYIHKHYIGHAHGFKLSLTLNENLELMRLLLSENNAAHAKKILTDLRLTSLQHKTIHQLSAGQKQKLALAKLFLWPRKLWLLDEPLTSLDDETKSYFFENLNQHVKEKGIAIISTHQSFPAHLSTKELKLCLS